MNLNSNDIDEYIGRFPAEIKIKLQEIRQTIRKAAPEATEKISYQMPTFFYHGNLVHFAAFKNHIGFYPIPTTIKAFKDELTSFKHSKGGIQFPLDKPLPLTLITKMVKFRLKENTDREALKSNKKKKD